MASPSIPTALRHPHLPTGRRILLHSTGEPCPRSTLPFRQARWPVIEKGTYRRWHCISHEESWFGQCRDLVWAMQRICSSSLCRSWDLIGQIGDDHDVLIECRDVHKSFGDKQVLKGVSFKIRHGEAVGIISPSGTGKSNILKVMAGFLAPDKGNVIICGRKRHGLVCDEDISGLRIGLVFQSAALFDSFTVRENVGFLLYENSNLPDERIGKLVTETLGAVGLKVSQAFCRLLPK